MRVLGAIIFAAALASAWAACPNACSGHGHCNEMDRCVCFKSQGTKAGQRASWTGNDCSQRVCPYGKSFSQLETAAQEVATPFGWIPKDADRVTADAVSSANVLKAYLVNGLQVPFDLNVEVELTSFSHVAGGEGTGTYRYKRDVDRYWSAPVSFDSQAGTTLGLRGASTAHQLTVLVNNVQKDTGLFIYMDDALFDGTDDSTRVISGDKWFFNVTYNDGSDYKFGDDGTSHQMLECSSQGMCNRQTGLCECFPGYAGDNCGRTMCPNDCSGHGVCQSLGRFATEAGYTYTAFDANMQYGCSCDAGFRGPDCSMVECPSGPDPMIPGSSSSGGNDCSGRGLCDYSTGQCKCAKGFFGERCESLTTLV